MTAPFPSATSAWHQTTYPSLSPSRPELSAKGKIVVVTGGGTGIGAETARYFAEAGASKIILLGRRERPLLETKSTIEQKNANTEVLIASTDITKKVEVDAAFSKLVGNDKVHVLISSAAIIGPPESLRSVDDMKFLNAVQQNLQGSLNVAQAFLRCAVEDAVIIDVNSSAAHLNYTDAYPAYAVSKFAVYRLWDSIGFGNKEMSVFHVQPGVIDTAMNKEVDAIAAMGGYEDNVSLPASFNVWLASPEARFLKGKFLWANWDVDELKARAEEIEAGTLLNIALVGWPFQQAGYQPGWER